MDYKDSAKKVYRGLVSLMIRDLVSFPVYMQLTQIAVELHLTIGQMSRVYHGVCSLSPERFLVLNQLWRNKTGILTNTHFIISCETVFKLPFHGID